MTSASQARNAIKKCFKTILDPKPTEAQVDFLWKYFDSSCAYCGKRIERESRTGHKDHLVAQADGGLNGLGNLIFSCAICNGDEKLESGWNEFLKQKCSSDKLIFEERRQRVLDWIDRNGGVQRITAIQYAQVELAFQHVNKVLTEQVEKLRRPRDA